MLQSKNAELNASAIQNFKKMSGDIQKSVVKQSQSADAIVRGIKDLRAGTGFVKQTIAEQATTSESIAEVVNGVFTRAQVIANGTNAQSQLLEEMLASLAVMKDRSESGILLCEDLESAVTAIEEGQALHQIPDEEWSDAPDDESPPKATLRPKDPGSDTEEP